METINSNTFKFILKDKDNSHSIPASKLESILSYLRKFIKSTTEHLSSESEVPELKVLALPASSFGIKFEVGTNGFDFDDIVPEVVKSIKEIFVDIDIMDENELYDLVYTDKKYSPKQLKNFSSLSKVIVNSGYDFIYEYKDQETGEFSNYELTENNKENLSKIKNTLIAGEEAYTSESTIECTIVSVNTNRNGFTLVPKNNIDINKHITLYKEETLSGIFSDTLISDLKKHKTNIPVPSTAMVDLKIETNVNYNNNKPVSNKFIIKKVLIVED